MDGLAPGAAHEAELDLAARAAEGDEAALRSVLEPVGERLRRIAWHMTYDHHDAQDLVQEALLDGVAPAEPRRIPWRRAARGLPPQRRGPRHDQRSADAALCRVA